MMVATAKPFLRHLRLDTNEPVVTSSRSNWQIHIRDSVRRSKVHEHRSDHSSPAVDQLKASRKNRHASKIPELARDFPDERKEVRTLLIVYVVLMLVLVVAKAGCWLGRRQHVGWSAAYFCCCVSVGR